MISILKSNRAIYYSTIFVLVAVVLLLALIKQTNAQQQSSASGTKPSTSAKAHQPAKTIAYAQNADWIERDRYGGARNVFIGLAAVAAAVVGMVYVVSKISERNKIRRSKLRGYSLTRGPRQGGKTKAGIGASSGVLHPEGIKIYLFGAESSQPKIKRRERKRLSEG